MTQDLIDQLRGLLAKATPGPWDVWRESCPSKFDAIAELTEQVNMTEPFSGELFLLNAGGKCPAATGCGPKSEANADLITAAVNALPGLLDTIESQAREIERLREALEPFALSISPEVPDDQLIDSVGWTARQHRAARAALIRDGE